MAKTYQYDASGYFVGEFDDYGGPLPNNATRTAPQKKDGYIPRWNGKQWDDVENHKGKEGYVDGIPTTIKEYGPLPSGWSVTPPPPTTEEKAAQIRAQRDGLITGTDYLMMPDYPISDAYRQAVSEYRQALRDITDQEGFPSSVVWPEAPKGDAPQS